ncbi:DMT family transporter [Pedobacter faecalis]|uniref:DMT family transporter n=1 Tax=Pedobacter faecalis TaxID=3041495 RepID=UPI00254EAD3D|nr:DMT family transporter [Pedobacter sp. ELA7]
MLKLARRYKINIPQAVTWNYFFAIILAIFFFRPEVRTLSPSNFSLVYLALGILLPSIFWFLAASVRNIGIVKTDIAQRLSLFIPIIAAYVVFQERFSTLKIVGLCVGFLAIFFTLYKKSSEHKSGQRWIYPLMVFIGFGVIDTLFKRVAQVQTIPYTSSLILIFGLAFILSLCAIMYLRLVRKQRLQMVNFVCGCILGFFNFFNILFYLKAHQAMADNPSTVFAAMNMGVIIAGTLVGIFLFKEKLNRLNYLGLTFALCAIILIAIAQKYQI